jgi:hypothetical protein
MHSTGDKDGTIRHGLAVKTGRAGAHGPGSQRGHAGGVSL